MTSSGEQALAEQTQDAPLPPSSRRSGGKPPSGNRGGMSRDVQVSKALSKLLRHDAVKAGLKLDDEGFADVEQVVSVCFLLRLSVVKAAYRGVVRRCRGLARPSDKYVEPGTFGRFVLVELPCQEKLLK